jgi:lactate dehydrogenase-like 2-hydroxyacid dehydrogenase
MAVLQVGNLPPSLAHVLAVKYEVLQFPNYSSRSRFLAQHGASVTAIVDFGPPGVDADLLKALPNLGAVVHHGDGYKTVDVAHSAPTGHWSEQHARCVERRRR